VVTLVFVVIVTAITFAVMVRANNRGLAPVVSIERQKILDTAIALLTKLRNDI
jgi:hypothetical protein